MPELPEVEIMVRNLRRWTAGRRVLGIHRLDTRLSEDVVAGQGGWITAAWRRGKYAVLDVQGPMNGHLVFHFRMGALCTACD